MKILVVPTTDWVGHPVLERQHHIFERLTQRHEVYILRFRYHDEKKLNTKAMVYEIEDNMAKSLAVYYLINVSKHWRAIREIVRTKFIDAVVLSNLLPACTTIRALKKKALTIFDLSDHFPTSGAGYVFDFRSILGKLTAHTLEMTLKSILKKVDLTVTCSYPLKKYARSLGSRNVSVVPNGVDETFFTGKYYGSDIRQKYNLGESIVIGFVGMIEFWLDLTPLLHAVKELRRKYDIKLFLVGGQFQTRAQIDVLNRIKELKIAENVIWSNSFVPYYELPNYIDSMDICVIPFDHTHPTAYFSAPNKLWEYLALRKPVLTTPIPDVLAQAGQFVNIVVTTQDYIKVIQDYIKNPKKYCLKAKAGQRIAENCTWTKIAKMYERLLKTLTATRA